MPDFTALIMHVGQLFTHPNLIEAPPYQRSFAWEAKEGGQLLDDISSALEEAATRDAGDYFLGTMLFIDRDGVPSRLAWPRSKLVRVLEVVDGFQRLTTLTILLCVLRDLDAEDDEPGYAPLLAAIHAGASMRPRLTLRPPDEAFLGAHVREPGATWLAPERDLQPPEARILDVRNHLHTMLAGYDAAERRRLAQFLLERCCVVVVTTTGIDRAHRMFTVLNTAGKSLARNDILKAFLLGSVAKAEASRCLVIWDEAEKRLGDKFEALFSHIRAAFGQLSSPVITGIMDIAHDKGGAQAFIEHVLQPAARIVDGIDKAHHEGSPHSAAIMRYLRYLSWQSFSDWKPCVLAWLLEKGEDAAGLARFLARLDRLVLGIRLLGIGGGKRGRRFGHVVASIMEGRDLWAADSPLEFSRHDMRTIHRHLRDLHDRNGATAKQLLLRLTDLMAGEPRSASLPSDMTVEHVLPRKFGHGSPWREWHPDPNDRELCTESLGNLVLVTKAQNDKAGNHAFAKKLDIYFNTPGAPHVAVNEGLRGQREWKPAQIRAREAALLTLISEHWDFGPLPPSEPNRPAKRPKSKGGGQARPSAP